MSSRLSKTVHICTCKIGFMSVDKGFLIPIVYIPHTKGFLIPSKTTSDRKEEWFYGSFYFFKFVRFITIVLLCWVTVLDYPWLCLDKTQFLDRIEGGFYSSLPRSVDRMVGKVVERNWVSGGPLRHWWVFVWKERRDINKKRDKDSRLKFNQLRKSYSQLILQRISDRELGCYDEDPEIVILY